MLTTCTSLLWAKTSPNNTAITILIMTKYIINLHTFNHKKIKYNDITKIKDNKKGIEMVENSPLFVINVG
jgi:hypothetical protein